MSFSKYGYEDGRFLGDRMQKRLDTRRDWVWPERTNYTRDERPYSFSDYFIWRDGSHEDLKTAHAEYSDRMQGWDYAKWQEAVAAGPDKRIQEWSQEDVSKFLTHYHGKPIKAVALSEGCNASNGYPYFVFYFRDAGPKRAGRKKKAS